MMLWFHLGIPALLVVFAAASGPAAAADSLMCEATVYCNAGTCLPGAVTMTGTEKRLMGNTSGERQLQRSVRLAMDAVQRFGPLANPSVASLHLSFQYLCCYNHTELAGIARAIRAVKWAPVSATFNRIVCAAGEFVALASPASQGQLFGVVAALEEAMARAGYPVHRYRAAQFAFHVSLFQPPFGAKYPNNTLADMLAAANAALPPGGLNIEPIAIDSFDGLP